MFTVLVLVKRTKHEAAAVDKTDNEVANAHHNRIMLQMELQQIHSHPV